MNSRKQLGVLDAVLLYLDSAKTTSHIAMLCKLDGLVSFDKYLEDFRLHRLDKLPFLQQVIKKTPLALSLPSWYPAHDFQLEDHIALEEIDYDRDSEEFNELIDNIVAFRFSPNKPLWKLTLLNNISSGESHILFHMHHCITDGAGLPKLLNILFDASPDNCISDFNESPPGIQSTPQEEVKSGNLIQKEFDGDEEAYKNSLKAYLVVLKDFMRSPGLILSFNAPLSGQKNHYRIALPLAEVQGVAKKVGGSVNDVYLATVAGALDGWLKRTGGIQKNKCWRVYQAVDARSEENRDAWGNHLAFLPILIPMGLDAPQKRLEAIIDYTQKLKQHKMQKVSAHLVKSFLNRIPFPLLILNLRVMYSKTLLKLMSLLNVPPMFNVYVTNAQLPDVNQYIGHKRMIDFSVCAPLVPNTGLTIAAINYDDTFHIDFTADTIMDPELKMLEAEFKESFEALKNMM